MGSDAHRVQASQLDTCCAGSCSEISMAGSVAKYILAKMLRCCALLRIKIRYPACYGSAAKDSEHHVDLQQPPDTVDKTGRTPRAVHAGQERGQLCTATADK